METPLSLTKYWLEKIVIGLDLCPFARIPYEKGLVKVVVSDSLTPMDQMHFFIDELELLNNSGASELSTTLIVFSKADPDFLVFNDLVGDAEFILEESGLASTFQVVAFHPEFVFKGTEFGDIGNYVNRAPFPVIHILRSAELALVMKKPEDGEVISFNNDKKLHQLFQESPDIFEQLFHYLNPIVRS